MVLFNILEFDGEAVGGGPNLVLGEQQRRRIPFFTPPAEDGFGCSKLDWSNPAQNTEYVVIGKFAVVVADRGRPVQNDRDEVLAKRIPQFLHELVEGVRHAIALLF